MAERKILISDLVCSCVRKGLAVPSPDNKHPGKTRTNEDFILYHGTPMSKSTFMPLDLLSTQRDRWQCRIILVINGQSYDHVENEVSP
jgi:hypothetical protein